VSIGAFEHFRHERYDDFFTMTYNALPEDGSMLLHTITSIDDKDARRMGIPLTLEIARFVLFIAKEIFPGGQLPRAAMVEEHAAKAGFNLARRQEIGPHYVRTLQLWAEALEAHREQAIAAQSQEVYDRYIKVPHRLCAPVPRRVHQRQPVHPAEVAPLPKTVGPRPERALNEALVLDAAVKRDWPCSVGALRRDGA
jgi:cyclopropane-fatty-acyl-phospholipid synthase